MRSAGGILIMTNERWSVPSVVAFDDPKFTSSTPSYGQVSYLLSILFLSATFIYLRVQWDNDCSNENVTSISPSISNSVSKVSRCYLGSIYGFSLLFNLVCAVKITHGKVLRCWVGLTFRIPGSLLAYECSLLFSVSFLKRRS